MRFELLAVLTLSACAVDLEDEPAAQSEAPDAPVVAGCAPFADVAEITRVGGALRSLELADGRVLWTVGAVELADGRTVDGVGLVTDNAELADCLSGAGFFGGDAAPLLEPAADRRFAPLDAALIAGIPHLYYEALEPDPTAPFGYALLGVGLAPNFVASGALSWTADRPRFGVAATVVDEHLYAWGCAPARFLSADCFLARAPVDDVGAYEYARGGGYWTANADRAWPLVEASSEISVAALTSDRWLMAYAPPLSRSIVLRTGLSVAGPWSQPVTAATCATPSDDPEAFCREVALHPMLETAPNTIALSYSVGTFSSMTVPRELALQLVALEIPDTLP